MGSHTRKSVLFLLLSVLLASGFTQAASRGKIMGRIFDEDTGNPLIGANILLEGTNLGAASDAGGNFFIINITPGNYTVRASMIGYADRVLQNVQVSINQTTNLVFPMVSQAVMGQEVVVEAQAPVVQLDITSSRRVVTAENILDRPLENMEEILAAEVGISLQANEEGTGLVIRGGGLNETDIVIDGLSTRNERNQQPLTNLNLTAIKEIEVLTGGFNAEFGDIRAGMINVVTKEGSPNRYTIDLDARTSPAAFKHFGPSPFNTDGPFWSTYAGEDAYGGITPEMVDAGEYPFTFVGWNEVARQFLNDANPDNDMTPQELLEVWKWQHRQREYATQPDYIADFTVSGPLPLTPATFLLSHRYENLQLAYPFSRDNSLANTTLFKVTASLSDKIKISFNNQLMKVNGVSGSIYDDSNGMITGSRQGNEYASNAMFWRYMWHDANYNPIETTQYHGGISLNHMLSQKTYYHVGIEYTTYKTVQEPIGRRDTTGIKQIGTNMYDESPFGYVGTYVDADGNVQGSIIEKYDILGDFLMSGGGRGQDHSKYWGLAGSFDLVSQINRFNEIKMGFTMNYTSFEERREINHGQTTRSQNLAPGNWWYYDSTPLRAGTYIQDKLEFKGMIANIGVRADFIQPDADGFILDPDYIYTNLPYNTSNYWANDSSFDHLRTDKSTTKTYVSPRLGISHPLTDQSKIFFNYGHAYQAPVMERLYTVRPFGSGAEIPNLDADWPRTVSYEIVFEQALANQILIHVMGYYRDVSGQLSRQNIVSLDRDNDVSTWANNSYADIRGLELKLEKRTGNWLYGWVSLEYMVRSTGYTGLRYLYENRQLAREQREETNQDRGWPTPSVKANLTFRIPREFGPAMAGLNPLGDWRLNILQEWEDGGKDLLNPDALLSDQQYVEVIDHWNTDLLLEKRIRVAGLNIGAFFQVKNLFNYRGFVNPLYWNQYVESLHFPHETGDQKGTDKMGDWDKDHIELGYNTWAHHMNPRDIFFGIRVQF